MLWVIHLATVGFTLAGAWWLGGRRLLATVAFPVLFFLTAVPWPAKFATPVQQALMTNVAQVVSEMLLWLGVPVQLVGVLALAENQRREAARGLARRIDPRKLRSAELQLLTPWL